MFWLSWFLTAYTAVALVSYRVTRHWLNVWTRREYPLVWKSFRHDPGDVTTLLFLAVFWPIGVPVTLFFTEPWKRAQ